MTKLTTNKASSHWDSIVIGSGIGGLVTAGQLASKGAKVLVLEQYKIPGGSGGSFKRKGFTFDVGASMIFGFGNKGYTNLLTRALKDVGQRCETIPDPTQLAYHLPNQLEITVDRDYKKFITKLIDLFPHEEKGIKHFYETCWDVFNCLNSMPLLSIEDPRYLMKVFFKSPLSCLGLARWLPINAGDVARRHIKDPALLKFIDIECFCWSVMPAELTPMINAGMVFSDRHYGGINYPKGGVGIIAEKLVEGIRTLKGEVQYNSKVKKVIFKNREAIGVLLESGKEIFGKTIVSNATRWDTFGGQGINDPLVELNKTPTAEKKWKNRYIPSPSFLSVHLGVSKDLIPSNTHCHHLLLDTWEEMDHEQGVTFLSIPTLLDPSLAPSNGHIVHAFTPSSMDCWEGLSNTEYLDKKKKDGDKLISKLEKLFPNLSQNILHKEIGSPRTHKRFLSRNKGSYGPIPSMRLPGLLPMPFNTTKIKGLYCVGDSAFPGQGLNAVAFSGYACAHIIGAKLGMNKWELPS